MNTFGNFMNSILKYTDKWDYYNISNCSYGSYENVFKDSRIFIESILSHGEKLSDFDRYQFGFMEDGFRLKHTVSIYFLGLIIYENVSKIRSAINDYIRQVDLYINEANTPFSYFWFLICFYHDFGYSFESEDRNTAIKRLVKFFDEYIPYALPRRNHRTGVPRVISDNIQKYSIFRYVNDDKLDHGIVAGLLFWYEREKDYFTRRKNHSEETFIEKNLLWSKKMLYHIHLPVAWTISAHNVWFRKPNSENSDIYRKYGLEKLIINRPIVRLRKHPMLFLLSIVDTIDPVKLLSNNNVHNFNISDLDLIEFKFTRDTIMYRINLNDVVVTPRYKENVVDMNSWLCCHTYYNNGIFSIRV